MKGHAVRSVPLSDDSWFRDDAIERDIAMPEELATLYAALVDADERADTQVLARVGWGLYAAGSAAQHAHREAVALLYELRAAACAVAAGDGSTGSLALLRHVLAAHGWLPPANATPLQVLAAPPRRLGTGPI